MPFMRSFKETSKRPREKGDQKMEDRTERIERVEPTSHHTEVVTPSPRTVDEVHRVERPATEVDRVETVAYDPYANRRMLAYRLTQLIYWVFGLIEGLILIRFVLKALGANPSAGFAQFIYGITAPFVAPFVGLFGNPQAQGSVLELNSLIALVVYALVAWLLAKLVWILLGETRSAIHAHSTQIDQHI
jgi:uncharacterized membrane protein